MCGIVGYVGFRKASDVIVDGLTKLEYRGYDSAGIAVNDGKEIEFQKYKGRLNVLSENLESKPMEGTIGIGHTRWATHGVPSDVNSHPHLNMDETIAVVHNGIIENYMEIKEWLVSEGVKFKSETDTEVIAHLVDHYYEGDLLQAVFKAIKKLRGAYALGVVCKDNPEQLVAVRKDSPLIVGIGENENFIASDVPAILKYTRDVYFLDNGEVVTLEKNKVTIYNEKEEKITKAPFHVMWDVEAASKGGYDHFMIKEINEQPNGIKETLVRRLDENGKIKLDDIKLTKEDLDEINKVYIVACGTAYNAGITGRYAIERFAKIAVETDVASEFRYRNPFIDDKTLIIVVSQSGETADTLAVVREGKEKGARVLAITNVVGSSIAREADDVFYTWAGPEVAVASTKAYTTQLVALYMIALDMGIKRGTITEEFYNDIINELKLIPEKVQKILDQHDEIKEIAKEIKDNEHAFYIGRGLDYNLSLEGSLKIKEISYMHAEAFAAGELKHGTIALIEENTPVVATMTQTDLFEKSISNIKEVKSRGAHVIAITQEGNKEAEQVGDRVIYIPRTNDILQSIIAVVPHQLLAYYVAILKDRDVDKPRNLAKSVTVE
ncbi:glutamine-fructose-6-phosphate transaminase (isomerizing) [Clostridium sporogenes]|jgi:glucosamine--fructose-6-phosphate aminotransferase (isomerizing)|uniref:Glutamine--fructose-6-phosphate aminotransferase [isomerizing] n=3 Tax=Clostridium TaxID=1485 RepID=A0AAE4Z2Q6_CLOSG|nr:MULTISPECIES: glutamine--fructose-6-phosphate transaminase (isomerizing) [Clostridium]MBE6078485.1 glutamine--fructose-6-phosphate transaminase (isomerizing) [Clostridium lundense]AVQ38278.1 glutamine--fructose-6-phosphate transaminase (isomerizing) [Clostridium botulinum]KIS22320.1 glutamine--fructose-6-phosphate aminotransferase [Clostridium botulinum B2 450]MCW6092199.1 glutamine--fructose-6-phosphate transaminase (isomerizing) [Clostridium sporogenes]MCW7996589.1 glutamine-fructose-6-ph